MGFIKGVGIGALAMYFLDPDRGPRRRAKVRDQWNHMTNMKRNTFDVMKRDFTNRARGLMHEAQARFKAEHPSDDIVIERIRSTMGHTVSHPGALRINANNGRVTLQGDILASEVEDLIHCVRSVRGVTGVDNQLDVHRSAEGVSSLQGGASRPEADRMTPAAAMVVGTAGLLLTLYGLGRRGIVGTTLGFVGTTLLAKSFGDTEHRFEPVHREPMQQPKRSSNGSHREEATVGEEQF